MILCMRVCVCNCPNNRVRLQVFDKGDTEKTGILPLDVVVEGVASHVTLLDFLTNVPERAGVA